MSSLRSPSHSFYHLAWRPRGFMQDPMGATGREHGVLKLVHPGGFVEVHRKPVVASQVLEKNPRHCITPPDVFKNPHLVVRPDAVLNTGGIFFIVPNRTLYRLMRASPHAYPARGSSECVHVLGDEWQSAS